MDLSTATIEALARTAALHVALSDGRLADCPALLEQRGVAMRAFQAAHEAAPEAERDACNSQIIALVTADEALQAVASRALGAAGDVLRDRIGGPPHRQRAYDIGTQACVDRKA